MKSNSNNLRSVISSLANPSGYTVMAYYQLDKRLDVVGEKDIFSLEGAIFIAESGIIEDERYNYCIKLRGLGIGLQYFVTDSKGKIIHRVKEITLN